MSELFAVIWNMACHELNPGGIVEKRAKNRLFLLLSVLTVLIIALIFILSKFGLFAKPELTLIERGPYNYVYTEHTGSFQKISEAHKKTEELVV